LLHHIFAVAGKLRFPLSQQQKHHIPRTLNDIPLGFIDIMLSGFAAN
jgi:hypothetical protein